MEEPTEKKPVSGTPSVAPVVTDQKQEEKAETKADSQPVSLAVEKNDSKEGKKADKKAKRKSRGQVSERKSIIISLALSVVCGALGAFGGMYLYDSTHKITTSLAAATTTTSTISEKAAKIQSSLSAGTILTDFGERPYDIVSYACYKQAISPYAMMVGYSKASSSASTTVVHSATVSMPDQVFYQNISNTSATIITLNTAYRFYDKKAGVIKGYELKVPADWAAASSDSGTDYAYDDYIQAYGKLFKGDYFCTSDTSKTVSDKYLTDTESVYSSSTETSKHEVNGVIVYIVQKSTVNSYTFVSSSDGGYDIELVMNAAKATYYYKVQMKKTGGLDDYPSFSSTDLKFHLDKDLNLVYSEFHDIYTGQMSIINVALDMTLYQRYFHSDTADGFTDKDGNKLTCTIPELNDISDPYTTEQVYDFSAYEK